MNLELKHLSPYLPYELKVVYIEECNIETIIGLNIETITTDCDDCDYDELKPILRPLSDLSKQIDGNVNNVRYYSMLKSCYSESDIANVKDFPLTQKYEDFQIMLSYHFDVFGLIPAGLAIDINTLES